MAQYEQYEVWILDGGEWTFKSSWRDFEVGWAVARAHTVPVRLIRAVYSGDVVLESNVIAELQAARKNDL
jgi:hypothetical protein